jgi:polyhydroxyalkanoate synthesis regulator phasin
MEQTESTKRAQDMIKRIQDIEYSLNWYKKQLKEQLGYMRTLDSSDVFLKKMLDKNEENIKQIEEYVYRIVVT